MEQLVFFDIPCPCIGICKTDEKGYCEGCYRNRNERFNWQQFSQVEKMEVIRLCKGRKRRQALFLYKKKQEQIIKAQYQVNGSFDFGD